MASARLRLQLLGIFLDLLDLALQLFHSQFVLHLALLVIWIPSQLSVAPKWRAVLDKSDGECDVVIGRK
jgi:hypothetical protein